MTQQEIIALRATIEQLHDRINKHNVLAIQSQTLYEQAIQRKEEARTKLASLGYIINSDEEARTLMQTLQAQINETIKEREALLDGL